MTKTINFLGYQTTCDSSWDTLFTSRVINNLAYIETQIKGGNITPTPKDIFRFLSLDLNKIKVIIIGQDPYPKKGIATGRAFEMNNTLSWNNNINASLRNIIKLLHKNNRKGNSQIKSIKDVRKDISNKTFKIENPSKLFLSWEKKGVLLLNSALTCEINNPNSHSLYWCCFIPGLINYISSSFPQITWFLWGESAQKLGSNIPNTQKMECSHPRLNGSKPGSFYYENHFSKVNYIKWI